MSVNSYGLDNDYFERKIAILHRDGLRNWTPDELARELARMSRTADASVMHEPEFSAKAPQLDTGPGSTLKVMRGPGGRLYLSGVEDLREGDVFRRDAR